MLSIPTVTEFFGWCLVLNLGFYLLIVASLALFRDLALRINARIFAISEETAARATFYYVAAYKLAITVLCFVPWLALKLMA